jgi:hypothetical protein
VTDLSFETPPSAAPQDEVYLRSIIAILMVRSGSEATRLEP